MSTYRQARKDDSSDDEGPTKRVKHDDEDDEGGSNYGVIAPPIDKRAKSRNIWADVVQEEELAIAGNVMDMDDYRKKDSGFVKIRRGAESYTVPSQQLEENAAALEAGRNMEEQAPPNLPTPSDDPFGETVDLSEVESFGVGPSSSRFNSGIRGGGWQSRGGRGGGGVRGGWMSKSRGGGGAHGQRVAKTEDGEAMELGEGGSECGGGGRGRGGGWRGRAAAPKGFIPRGRGGGNWRGGGGGDHSDRKRRWNNDHARDPAQLMDGGYSLAGLMATEFQEGLTPKELGEQIAKALGERVADTVVKIVEAVGEAKALELLEETKKAEQAGGVKVADGSRRRTPGGVFIMMFKADIDVEPEIKAKIFEDSRDQQRKTVKAKRNRNRKPQDVGKGLDELQKMLEAKKKELLEGGSVKKEEMEEGEATPSPDMVEGQEELDYGEDDETPSPEME